MVEVASQDAVTSPQVASMAYSAMGALLVLASRAQSTVLTSALMRASHVTKVVNTINDEDGLGDVLLPRPRSFAPLFTHEARLSFLLSLAQAPKGAFELVRAGLFTVLGQCRFLDVRPADFARSNVGSGLWVGTKQALALSLWGAGAPYQGRGMTNAHAEGPRCEPVGRKKPGVTNQFELSAGERYQRIAMPVLRLARAVVAEVGPGNRHAAASAQAFLTARKDWVLAVLRDRLAAVTLPTLEQIEALTGLVATLAGADGMDEDAAAEADGVLVRSVS